MSDVSRSHYAAACSSRDGAGCHFDSFMSALVFVNDLGAVEDGLGIYAVGLERGQSCIVSNSRK